MRGYPSLPDEKSWDSWDWAQTQVEKEDWSWLWSKGVKKGLFRYGHMHPGTIEGVSALAKLGKIVVITHRPDRATQDTMDWLSFNRLPISEVHVLSGGGSKQPKSAVPCDIYIDDRISVVAEIEVTRPDSRALLWDRPWNQTEGFDPLVRINSWTQAVQIASEFGSTGFPRTS
jgi:uncharacterized HAD superfamily protein